MNKSRGTYCPCGLVYPHDLLLRFTDGQWERLRLRGGHPRLSDSLLIVLPYWLETHLRVTTDA